jgi:hypothetical protein
MRFCQAILLVWESTAVSVPPYFAPKAGGATRPLPGGGAGVGEIAQRGLGDGDAVLVGLGVDLHELAHHAEADAAQARRIGIVRIGPARQLAVARRGRGIARVVAGDRGQHGRGVLHGAAQQAGPVARQRGRDEAGAAHQAVGRHDAD